MTWKGSPKLVIPNSIITEAGLTNKLLTIKVVVSSIEASEQTGTAAEDLSFSKEYQF